MGYKDRVIHLDFSEELSDSPDTDKLWVKIRNPRLLPPAELQSFSDGNTGSEPVLDPQTGEPVLDDETGRPKVKVTDPQASNQTLHKMVSRLVVAARMYDATEAGEFDPETGDPVGEQPRMPPTPWTPEVAAKLPLPVLSRIAKEFGEAVNPQKPGSPGTPKTSSGQPSPSSTEPGAEAQPPPN